MTDLHAVGFMAVAAQDVRATRHSEPQQTSSLIQSIHTASNIGRPQVEDFDYTEFSKGLELIRSEYTWLVRPGCRRGRWRGSARLST